MTAITTLEKPAFSHKARAFCEMMQGIISDLRNRPALPNLMPLEIMYRTLPNGRPGVLHHTHMLCGVAEPGKLARAKLPPKCLLAGGTTSGWFHYLRISVTDKEQERLELQVADRSLEPTWLVPRLSAFSDDMLGTPNINLSYGPFEV